MWVKGAWDQGSAGKVWAIIFDLAREGVLDWGALKR